MARAICSEEAGHGTTFVGVLPIAPNRSCPDGHDEHLFHGAHARHAGKYGKSKEKRYDRRPVSIGLLATKQGVPIGYEVFPGNTSDVEAFRAMRGALKTRFQIRRVIICADRGMVSDKILKELRGDGVEYIVGARPSLAVEEALSYTGANWQPVEKINIRIKPMGDDGETYIVCYNPAEAEHDRDRRREIVARLRRQLGENPSAKSLLRNSSFKSQLWLRRSTTWRKNALMIATRTAWITAVAGPSPTSHTCGNGRPKSTDEMRAPAAARDP